MSTWTEYLMPVLEAWIDENYDRDPGALIGLRDIHRRWMETHEGQRVVSYAAIGRTMTKLGYKKLHTSQARYWIGLKPK